MARRRRFVAVAAAAGTSLLGSAWEFAPAQAATNPQAGYAPGNGLQPGSGKTSPEEDVTVIAAPTLVVLGEVDIARLENAVALFRLIGGGVPADLVGLSASHLAVLPGTTYGAIRGERGDQQLVVTEPFLTALIPTAA
jgi:hypothetical protein